MFGVEKNLWGKYGNLKGQGVKVAVLDTGICASHPDLKSKIFASKNFTSSKSTEDAQGHGTHCCGIIGGNNKNRVFCGIAPECQLIVGKVLGDDGKGEIDWIDDGINWAVSQGADVISMSLGCEGHTARIFAKTIARAISKGVIVVVAGGNSGPYKNTVEAPGNFTPCVTVGAVDAHRRVAKFSSRGAQIDVTGPGVNILSTFKGNKYAYLSGTSMATPFVAGVAALYLQRVREVHKGDAKNIKKYSQQKMFEYMLKKTSMDLGPKGFDINYGSGYVNAIRLINSI